MQETHIQPLGWEDPLKKAMAAHFKNGILAWRVAWTEEPGMLQSMGLQRVWHELLSTQIWRNKCEQNSNEQEGPKKKKKFNLEKNKYGGSLQRVDFICHFLF